MAVSESEQVDAAVDAALELVEEGDAPLVAADYVAEQRDLEHRFWDIHERLQEAIDDE